MRKKRVAPGLTIERHPDPKRINGLVVEDRLRTTRMFVAGNVAWRPNQPIDIAASADLIQGLPTHVKSTLIERGINGQPLAISVDMACTLQLFMLTGWQRLLVAPYEIETWLDEEGRPFDVLRYDRIIEIILSPETLARMRGSVSVAEIRRIRDLIAAWDPATEDIKDARLRLHPMNEALKPRMGLARSSVKLSLDRRTGKPQNKRIQSTLPIEPLMIQVMGEGEGADVGVYRGRSVQARYIEHDATTGFHGLDLPWRTRANWTKLPRTGTRTTIQAPTPAVIEGPHARYVERWLRSDAFEIPGGHIAVMHHEDGMCTVVTESDDDEVRKHVSQVCRLAGGEWIGGGRCWLVDVDAARRIVRALKPRGPLPAAPRKVLEAHPRNENLPQFRTPAGMIRTVRAGTEWALRPEPRSEREARALPVLIASVCRAYGVGRFQERGRWRNWMIASDPESLLNDVASAMQTFPDIRADVDEGRRAA